MLNSRARIPVIPLSYADRHLAVEKELVVDYETGKIYIISSQNREVIFDITEIIKKEASEAAGDNITVEIEGIGHTDIGTILNKLYKSSITSSNSEELKVKEVPVVVKSLYEQDMANMMPERGQVIITTDTDEVYYDINDTLRKNVTEDAVILEIDADRLAITEPDPSKFYIVKETSKIFQYRDNTWKEITNSTQMSDYIDNFDLLVPTTIEQNGTLYAPRTLASLVYTEDGETIEERIKAIGKVSMGSVELVAEVEGQTEFTFSFPVEDYLESGNIIMVFIGSVWINPNRFTITGDRLIFTDPQDGVGLGRSVDIVFIYNAPIPAGNQTAKVIDGRYVMDGTIPITKLQKYSDSTNLNDSNSLATSKAVKTLNDSLLQKIADVAGNMVIHVTSAGTGSALEAADENFQIVDMANIYLRLHEDIGSNPTISVNGSEPYEIRTLFGEPILAGDFNKGDIINIVYNALENVFYLNNGESYILDKSSAKYIATGGEAKIAIPVNPFDRTVHKLTVYQNNLFLIEGDNYRFDDDNSNKIVLIDYTADAGDVFYFEAIKIVNRK